MLMALQLVLKKMDVQCKKNLYTIFTNRMTTDDRYEKIYITC